MHPKTSRALSLTGNLARRFAIQALVSGTVMVALQATSQMERTLAGVEWSRLADGGSSFGRPLQRTEAGESAKTDSAVEARPAPTLAADGPSASPRQARLPVPAGQDARARSASIAGALLHPRTGGASRAASLVASRETGSASETLRFDECRPACESRDPLLLRVAQREPADPALDLDTGPSVALPRQTASPTPRVDGIPTVLEPQPEPKGPTRVDALWSGVTGGWRSARRATGSVVGRIGESVGLLSAER